MKNICKFFHGLFIPKEENNFRAKALHIDSLAIYLILALFLNFFFKQISPNFPNVLGYATDITTVKLLELTNQERAKHNLPTLSYEEKLSSAAKKKAEDMFQKNYWSHYAPDGTSPWQFIISSDYQYEYAGENLAKNFMFSKGVIEAWMNSQSHRENLLKKDYTDVGFAIVNGVLNGEQTTLVVQMLGTPQQSLLGNKLKNEDQKPVTEILSQLKQSSMEQNVLSKNTGKTFFNFNILFLVFLILAVVLDFYFASKMSIVKIGGKNPAHFIFLGFVLIGLLLLTKGAIM